MASPGNARAGTLARIRALGLILLATPLLGWWDAGHLTVALIARDHLDPAARRQVERILAAGGPPGGSAGDRFLQAAVWPDLIKERGLKAMDSWHYIDRPLTPEGPGAQPPPGPDAVRILGQALDTLRNPQAGPWEKAFMLSWVIHLVADLHQPLHCASLQDARFPTGDRGGTLFALDAPATPNLHALWDSGLGLLPALRYRDYRPDRSDAPSRRLRTLAKALQRDLPPEGLDLDGTPGAWARESFALARDVAYAGIQPGQAPDPAYLAKARPVVARQLTLAGYRLAHLLNDLCGPRRGADKKP